MVQTTSFAVAVATALTVFYAATPAFGATIPVRRGDENALLEARSSHPDQIIALTQQKHYWRERAKRERQAFFMTGKLLLAYIKSNGKHLANKKVDKLVTLLEKIIHVKPLPHHGHRKGGPKPEEPKSGEHKDEHKDGEHNKDGDNKSFKVEKGGKDAKNEKKDEKDEKKDEKLHTRDLRLMARDFADDDLFARGYLAEDELLAARELLQSRDFLESLESRDLLDSFGDFEPRAVDGDLLPRASDYDDLD